VLAPGGTAPDAARLPERRRAIDGVQDGAESADAARGDEVDLDAGFVEGAEDACVVRAIRAGAGQHQRRTALGGIAPQFTGAGHPSAGWSRPKRAWTKTVRRDGIRTRAG